MYCTYLGVDATKLATLTVEASDSMCVPSVTWACSKDLAGFTHAFALGALDG